MLETIWNNYVEFAMAFQAYAPYVVILTTFAAFAYTSYAVAVYFRIWLDNRFPTKDK